MDNTNLAIIGGMLFTIIIAQLIQASIVISRIEKMERRILGGLFVVRDDSLPWEAETKPTIDERDYG